MAKCEEIPGFPLVESKRHKFIKEKKSKKSNSGFQSMGLNFEVIKGITKRGYNIPTPIQRKTIPLILEGRDVVAMAKTGSGKTACFLIPLFEKLKHREPTKGARALILSPTRELAIQTYKFIKEIGKFLKLKTILILGGDSMDFQFSAIHTCPDVIVATPGRFLHLCVEMDLKLKSIQYIVFDEADRLFEMGFGEQLNETLNRLPNARQTVLFSATLPKKLVEFARAGLNDPILIRLDVESKLPETLNLKFIFCRPDERYTSLIVLLKYLIPKNAQTIVFAATQYHIELISFILSEYGISHTSIYSRLDPTARKINTTKFQLKQVSVLVVTDVAARGIDIPSLDFVVNLHFPGKPKLFVHRVGRCARAGRSGTAYSIFSTDDQSHLLDLHLFLNRPFNINDSKTIGQIPQDVMEEEHLSVTEVKNNHNINSILRASENAYKKYITSRPVASTDANRRAKLLKFFSLKPLEAFLSSSSELGVSKALNKINRKTENIEGQERKLQEAKHNVLIQMKNFRPTGTIFELNRTQKAEPYKTMNKKRSQHAQVIERFRFKIDELDKEENLRIASMKDKNVSTDVADGEINETFQKIVLPKRKHNMDFLYKPKRKRKGHVKDEEHFIPYQSTDKHTEDGLAINSFDRQAMKASFSVIDRNPAENKVKCGLKKWDRIKKKMVVVLDPRAGKIKTESGAWIPASFKTGRYVEWKDKSKMDEQLQREADSENDTNKFLSHEKRYPVRRHTRHNAKIEVKKHLTYNKELRNPEQIVRRRIRLETIKKKLIENTAKKAENRKKSMRKNQKQKRKAGKKL